jgi:zinc transporter ZupT
LNGEITFWQVVAAYAFALGGGSISALLRLTHKPLCALISFAAGTLLGVTLFAILPESLTSSGLWPVGLAAATGYALFFFVSKYVHHVCPACAASHFDADATRHFGEIASALVVALAIHSTTDGVALGIGQETAALDCKERTRSFGLPPLRPQLCWAEHLAFSFW